MPQTFKDRLTLLMNGEKPYAWTQKVGIEKGLFQYYWQKGRIPSFKNLMKIQRYTGCSLDWLLTGRSVDANAVDERHLHAGGRLSAKRERQFSATVRKLKELYAEVDPKKVEAVEFMVNTIIER